MRKLLYLIIITLILSGCAATWTYDNTNYPTSAKAIEAVRQDVRVKVNSIQKLDKAIEDSVLIYVPSLHWSRKGVVVTGNASEEQIKYVATVLYYGFHGMAEGLKRRGLFKSTYISDFSQRDPLSAPNYKYLMWLRLDRDEAQWMISPGNDTSLATPLYTSPISDGGDRVATFVKSVEQYITRDAS